MSRKRKWAAEPFNDWEKYSDLRIFTILRHYEPGNNIFGSETVFSAFLEKCGPSLIGVGT